MRRQQLSLRSLRALLEANIFFVCGAETAGLREQNDKLLCRTHGRPHNMPRDPINASIQRNVGGMQERGDPKPP
jgi:hypothetical protein